MPPPPDAPPDGDGTIASVADPARATASVAAAVISASAAVPVVAVAPPVSAPPSSGHRPSGMVSGRAAVGTMPTRPSHGPGLAGAVGAARVGEAARSARTSAATARGPRRARLTVKRVDPWSVMKFSFAVSLVLFIVIIVATSVLYLALDTMGVFESVNSSLADIIANTTTEGGASFRITFRGVIWTALLLGAVNVVLVTALATLSAFIYNVCADLVGGVELTLSERD